MRFWKNISWPIFIAITMLLMSPIVWQYTSWELDVDFLLSKQAIIHQWFYQASFYIHIFSSLIILCCGAFLFSNYILKRWPSLHRWIGRAYVFLLLVLAAPSGLVMAFHANGGVSAKISFTLLTLLWWFTTFKGLQMILRKKVIAHQQWMIRSFALTLSAITLRFGQLVLGLFLDLDYMTQYVFLSWASWILNLGIGEIWIYWTFKRRQSPSKLLVFSSHPSHL